MVAVSVAWPCRRDLDDCRPPERVAEITRWARWPGPEDGPVCVPVAGTGMLRTVTADGLSEALDVYRRAQEVVEARNRLARAIGGAAMSGLTQAEIVELTGYSADRVVRICTDAGISGD
jgi:hypothetical protein